MAKNRNPKTIRAYGTLWNETQRQMKSDFMSLKADKETVQLVFVGEPFTRKEVGVGGKIQRRAYFSIITQTGLQGWGVGKRILQSIHELWPASLGVVFEVTRHGAKGNTDTWYSIDPSATPDHRLLKQAATVTQKELTGLQTRILESPTDETEAEDS